MTWAWKLNSHKGIMAVYVWQEHNLTILITLTKNYREINIIYIIDKSQNRTWMDPRPCLVPYSYLYTPQTLLLPQNSPTFVPNYNLPLSLNVAPSNYPETSLPDLSIKL